MNLRLTTVTRLAAAAFSLIALGLIAGVTAVRHAEQRETDALRRQEVLSSRAIGYTAVSDRLSRDARLFVLSGVRSYARDYWAQTRRGYTRDTALHRLDGLAPSAAAGRAVARARAGAGGLAVRELHAMRLVYAAQQAPARSMPPPVRAHHLPRRESMLPARAKLAAAQRLVLGGAYIDAKRRTSLDVKTFEELGAREANATANAAQRVAERWTAALVLLVAGFVALGAALLAFANRLVVRPVARYAAALQQLAASGPVRLEPTGVEELRLLGERFNEQLQSRQQALTDELTGLGNRRRLMLDLEAALAGPKPQPSLFALYDLDGFKLFNDTHGHLAGDALLERLGHRLEQAVAGHGRAYRQGGDEFCILVAAGPHERDLLERVAGALSEESGGLAIRPSFGVAHLPEEAREAAGALNLADQRMYAHKDTGRPGARGRELLLRLLDEQQADAHLHSARAAELAGGVARRLGLSAAERSRVVQAAELHDIGKVAVPAEILRKQGPLLPAEWMSIRTHSVIGERILASLPSLAGIAPLVRSSHERFDGSGYPDGLAGERIPLGARIVAVCDAFDAMTSERPYRSVRTAAGALAEIDRCSGSQFDPRVVHALREELGLAAPERRAA